MFKKVISAVSAAVVFFTLAPATALAVDRYEVLQIGDEDQWVLELQKKLNQMDYLKVPATGYFGTDTQNAVVKFQQDNALTADGKAGPETRQSLLEDDFSEIPDDRKVTNVASATFVSGTLTNSSSNAGDVLSLGDKGPAISALQEKLKAYEYYEYDSITGYFGPVTEEAVKKFQRTNKLTEDGVMGQSSLDILNSESVRYYTMYPGDRGDDIMQMQERLKQLGYFSAEPTGYYGDATVTAVKMFQDNNGLTADGKAGKDTRKLLYSDDAKKTNGTPAPSATAAKPEATQPPSAESPDDATDNNDTAPTADPAPAEPTAEPTTAPEPDPAPPVSDSTGVQKMLEIANSQIGKPYSYGSNGPNSYDCSGFVYYVMKNSGVATSRLSSAGYASVSNWATVSDVGSLAIGDLVFFKSDSSSSISHMGIYLGGGNFIHAAPSSGGVAVSGMSSGYYSRNFVTAKRIF